MIRYRTALTLLLFGVMLIVVLAMCPKEMRPAQIPVVVGGIVTLGIAGAGKSSFEHWTKRGQP